MEKYNHYSITIICITLQFYLTSFFYFQTFLFSLLGAIFFAAVGINLFIQVKKYENTFGTSVLDTFQNVANSFGLGVDDTLDRIYGAAKVSTNYVPEKIVASFCIVTSLSFCMETVLAGLNLNKFRR